MIETALLTAVVMFAGVGNSMDPTFPDGNEIFGCDIQQYGCQWEDLKEGDIIVFTNEHSPVGKTVHRIIHVDYDDCGYLTDVTTKGDGNENIMEWEMNVTEDRYITKILIDKDPEQAKQEILYHQMSQRIAQSG